jgi:peptide/nickel transport system permease protein
MSALIAKRLASAVVILVVLSAVIFALQKNAPLDPVRAELGAQASPAAVAHLRHQLGLDRPVLQQFGHYLTGLLHGNLGTSYRTHRPVTTDLRAYLPATLELTIAGLIVALFLAALFAFGSILRWPGAAVFRGLLLLGASTPAFLLCILGIIVFYQKVGILPASGRTSFANAPTGPTGLLTIDGLIHGRPDVSWDAIKHLILPAISIALGPAVAIGRVLRASMLADQHSDYARTARAKGLSELSILWHHLLRNTLGAALSMTGLQLGLMFAGVLVVEQVYGWPGIGQYIAQSIPVADFPAIAGVTLVLGAAYVVINTVVDILQAVADPRLKK